jgi:Mg2+/citrate symporter
MSQPQSSPAEHRPYKRRVKLIRPRLQLKLVGAFAGLSLFALVFQFILFGAVTARFAAGLPNDSDVLFAKLAPALALVLAASLALVMPFTFWIGVRMTHRIAGPVHRFESFLSAVAAGQRPPDFHLRDGDELNELAEWINEATRPLRRESAPAHVESDRTEAASSDTPAGPRASETQRAA